MIELASGPNAIIIIFPARSRISGGTPGDTDIWGSEPGNRDAGAGSGRIVTEALVHSGVVLAADVVEVDNRVGLGAAPKANANGNECRMVVESLDFHNGGDPLRSLQLLRIGVSCGFHAQKQDCSLTISPKANGSIAILGRFWRILKLGVAECFQERFEL